MDDDSRTDPSGDGGETSASPPDPETTEQNQEGTQSRSVERCLDGLEAVLEKTGRELRRPVIIEGALWYATTVMAVVLSGLLAAWLIPEHGYAVSRWVMSIGVGSATVGGAVALGYVLWRGPRPEAVASRIQRHCSAFRSDLVAALEFGRALRSDGGTSLQDQGVSPVIAGAHLKRTVRRVHDEARVGSLAHCVPTRELTIPAVACSAGVALLMIPLVLNPGWTLGVISGERVGAPVVGDRVATETIVGSVDGVFVYPSYTGRDRQFRSLGTGRIESLEGTEVHLQAALMPADWASLEMVVEDGSGEKRDVIDMTLDGGHQASASITLEESGHYWFRGETIDGRPVEDRATRNIEVQEDSPPQISVYSHEGRVEVEPDEVVTFELEATDDFGIDAIRQVHHFEGASDNAEREWLDIARLDEEPTSLEAEVEFDLAPLELQPKDSVVVYFEARDINTATGPGETKSDAVVLYVESPQDRHMESISAQQEAMESLLHHMADVMEASVGQRERQDDGTYRQQVEGELDDDERRRRYRRIHAVHEQRPPILTAMGDVVDQLDDDPMMVPRNQTLFEGLKERLQELQDDGDELFERLDGRADRRDLTMAHVQEVADYTAEAERRLENGVLSLEELLISQKMDLLEQTADEIEEMRERLRDLLEQYRDSDDPELREAIDREMERLRQRMQELMSRMQMQMNEMPQEHVNLEAMDDMDMQSEADGLGDQLDTIDDMLDDGDVDGALDALDDMAVDLDSMTGEMDDAFSEMQPQGISEFDEAVGDMMDEVSDLEEMERQIEEETRQFQQELRDERQEQLEAMLDPVTDELLEEIDRQQQGLDEMQERSLPRRDRREVDGGADAVESLREMVEQQDMEQSLERARSASDVLRSMRSTMTLSERYASEGSDEAEALRQSVIDSDEIVERADDIEEQIEEFMQQAQQDLEPAEQERFEELADDQQQALERAEQLRQEIDEMGGDYPQLQEELGPSIQGAEEAMGEAHERLGDRDIQPALDAERQAIEELGELGDSMSSAMQQQRQQEREEREERGETQRSEDDEVEIPGEESGEVRERIREEMMEGMRDGRAEEYDSMIERYFRSLVE